MKKSSMVNIFLLALAAQACTDDEPAIQHCVDDKGVVIPERFCQPGWQNDTSHFSVEEQTYYNTYIVPQQHIYGISFVPSYRWHYDTVYVPYGNRVWSGSYTPAAGHVYTTPTVFRASAVSRGGFGSVGRSFSFGGGAGE